MLLSAKKLSQISFGELMSVYSETNLKNGALLAPDETKERQIALAEQDFYEYLHNCFFMQPDAEYYIWAEQGRYISALRLEPYRDGLLLEALETKPSHRNRGWASCLIRAVLEEKKQTIVYSHVNKKNASSLHTHLRCGFCIIQDYAAYVNGSVDSRAFTMRSKNF